MVFLTVRSGALSIGNHRQVPQGSTEFRPPPLTARRRAGRGTTAGTASCAARGPSRSLPPACPSTGLSQPSPLTAPESVRPPYPQTTSLVRSTTPSSLQATPLAARIRTAIGPSGSENIHHLPERRACQWLTCECVQGGLGGALPVGRGTPRRLRRSCSVGESRRLEAPRPRPGGRGPAVLPGRVPTRLRGGPVRTSRVADAGLDPSGARREPTGILRGVVGGSTAPGHRKGGPRHRSG